LFKVTFIEVLTERFSSFTCFRIYRQHSNSIYVCKIECSLNFHITKTFFIFFYDILNVQKSSFYIFMTAKTLLLEHIFVSWVGVYLMFLAYCFFSLNCKYYKHALRHRICEVSQHKQPINRNNICISSINCSIIKKRRRTGPTFTPGVTPTKMTSPFCLGHCTSEDSIKRYKGM